LATYPRKETQSPGVLAAYMARIGGRGGLLSHEEEVELGRRVRSGDDGEARRRLVEKNLGLAVCVARKYRVHGLPFEDPIQEGDIGLMKAEKS
jgi:RNA polymerase primary sigma factor